MQSLQFKKTFTVSCYKPQVKWVIFFNKLFKIPQITQNVHL